MFWIILGIGLMVAAFVLAVLIDINILNKGWAIIAVWVTLVGTLSFIGEVQEKETAIQALNGNNPYEMKILYEKGDTIAYDTIYIKK